VIPKLELVSKFHPKANLYEAPPLDSGKGRRPKKGAKAPAPPEVVAGTAERSRPIGEMLCNGTRYS
jgi:hypothetical protein